MAQFIPITPQWQVEKCEQFGLKFVKGLNMAMQSVANIPFQKKSIGADGNCFFRAISYLLTGNENEHALLRSLLVTHMKNNEDIALYSGYINIQNMDNYINNRPDGPLDHLKTFATEIEIYFMAHLLNTDIYVYDHRISAWQHFSGAQFDQRLQPSVYSLYIDNPNANHYDIVLSTVEPTQSPPRKIRKLHSTVLQSPTKITDEHSSMEEINFFISSNAPNFSNNLETNKDIRENELVNLCTQYSCKYEPPVENESRKGMKVRRLKMTRNIDSKKKKEKEK